MTSPSEDGLTWRPSDAVTSPQRVAPPGSSPLLDSIDQFRASFDAATARTDVVERDLLVAGRRVRLQFAGPALIPAIAPALGHLAAQRDEHETSSLTIGVWDAASTGVQPVPLPSGAMHHGESGPRFHGEHDGITVHAADATLSVVEAGRGTALHYVPDANNVRWYQEAAPLKDVVHAWVRTHDLELLHAAAVGHPDGGVLIVGAAGSGKSTTSLACLRAGLGYAGDDYVLVDVEHAFVHSMYSSAKLEWENFDRHPWLFRSANSRADAKALAFLARDVPERIVSGLPLRALLLPTITGRGETQAVPTTAARALLALAPSTVLQLPGHSERALGAMKRLVEQVPAFRLDLGTNVAAIPDVVETLLVDLGRG
jgi:hypothetical protein